MAGMTPEQIYRGRMLQIEDCARELVPTGVHANVYQFGPATATLRLSTMKGVAIDKYIDRHVDLTYPWGRQACYALAGELLTYIVPKQEPTRDD